MLAHFYFLTNATNIGVENVGQIGYYCLLLLFHSISKTWFNIQSLNIETEISIIKSGFKCEIQSVFKSQKIVFYKQLIQRLDMNQYTVKRMRFSQRRLVLFEKKTHMVFVFNSNAEAKDTAENSMEWNHIDFPKTPVYSHENKDFMLVSCSWAQ